MSGRGLVDQGLLLLWSAAIALSSRVSTWDIALGLTPKGTSMSWSQRFVAWKGRFLGHRMHCF